MKRASRTSRVRLPLFLRFLHHESKLGTPSSDLDQTCFDYQLIVENSPSTSGIGSYPSIWAVQSMSTYTTLHILYSEIEQVRLL